MLLVVVHTVWESTGEWLEGEIALFSLDDVHFQVKGEVIVFFSVLSQTCVAAGGLHNDHDLILVNDTQILKIFYLNDVLLEVDRLWLKVDGVIVSLFHGEDSSPDLFLVSSVVQEDKHLVIDGHHASSLNPGVGVINKFLENVLSLGLVVQVTFEVSDVKGELLGRLIVVVVDKSLSVSFVAWVSLEMTWLVEGDDATVDGVVVVSSVGLESLGGVWFWELDFITNFLEGES